MAKSPTPKPAARKSPSAKSAGQSAARPAAQSNAPADPPPKPDVVVIYLADWPGKAGVTARGVVRALPASQADALIAEKVVRKATDDERRLAGF